LPSLQQPDHTGICDPRLHLVAQFAQPVSYDASQTALLETQLWVHVKVTSPGDQLLT